MRFFYGVLIGCALVSCSEASEDSPLRADSGSAVVDSASDTKPPVDGGASATVVINEVRAADGDYVELMNTGTTTIDLGGQGLRGESGDAGTPNAFDFPAGTRVPAGGYVLVYANESKLDAGTADCKGAPATACFSVQWGISSTRGETIRLVDKAGATLSEVTVSKTIATGKTWGRIPNGTGAFQETTPTPAAENQR